MAAWGKGAFVPVQGEPLRIAWASGRMPASVAPPPLGVIHSQLPHLWGLCGARLGTGSFPLAQPPMLYLAFLPLLPCPSLLAAFSLPLMLSSP